MTWLLCRAGGTVTTRRWLGWQAALEIDPNCLMARLENRDLIEAELIIGQGNGDPGELKLRPAPVPSPLVGEVGPQDWIRDGIGSEGGSRVQSFVGPPLAPPFTRGGRDRTCTGMHCRAGRPTTCRSDGSRISGRLRGFAFP